MRFLYCVMISLSMLCGAAGAMAAPQPVSVAVLPFTKMQGDKTVWLDKAIADLVAQKLAETQGYIVLNRDVLQTLLKEMEFEQSGFVNGKQDITRVGRVLKAEQIIYGTYAVEGDRITIKLIVMDSETKNELGQFTESGLLANIIPLTQKLVMQLITNKGIAVSPAQEKKITFTPTNSLTALEHFYEGIHAYDSGDYEKAMGSFLAASQQDKDYLDAKLWLAKMLEQLGKKEQAVITYKELYQIRPQSTEGIDAQYFAARLLAESNPKEAIALLHTLSCLEPPLPQSLEAAYLEASLQRGLGNVPEAYSLYQQIDDHAEKRRKHSVAFVENRVVQKSIWTVLMEKWLGSAETIPSATLDAEIIASPQRQSRFFNWKQATEKYRDAITAMVELYADLPLSAEGKALNPPPRGSFVIDPLNPVITGDVKDKDKSLFGGDHTFIPQWKEMFYALIIPKGYVAVGIDLEITGQLPEPTESRDFTLRVMPFPLKENYQNSWLGVIFGQTPTTTTLSKHIPFFGKTQSLLALQLVENHSRIDRWKVAVKLSKETVQSSAKVATETSTHDGALLAKVRLGNPESRTIRTQPQYIMQWQPKQKLALANNFNDGMWLVGVKGDLLGEETNLWQAHSVDGGKNWSVSEPMTFNSGSREYAPTLVRGEDGALRLFFLSDRRGLGWELWTSTQNRSNKRWEHARLVPLRDFAATGFEEMKDISGAMLPYSVMQDNRGRWLVGFYSAITKKLHIISSDDVEKWQEITALTLPNLSSLALGQDLTGRYYAVVVDASTKLQLHTSNDAQTWKHITNLAKRYGDARAIATFPMTLLPAKDAMTLVFSDVFTGLQYATVAADNAAIPDLVTQSALDTFAITTTDTGYLTAQWKDDDIHIQQFTQLSFPQNPINPADQIIYTERSTDEKGGVWNRIFARERYRVPDVTAIDAMPNGRIWWGIETGIMALKNQDFFMSDVSGGFFHHFVDQITHCGERVWFASSRLMPARVGFNHGYEPNRASLGKSLRIPELEGAVIASACNEDETLFFASNSGRIAAMQKNDGYKLYALGASKTITSLAYDSTAKRLLAGMQDGQILSKKEDGEFTDYYAIKGHSINALTVDDKGNLWIAAQDDGLYVLDASGKHIQHYPHSTLTTNLQKLVKGKNGDVWAIASRYSHSPGLIRANLTAATFHNPPQKNLEEIIDFAIAEDSTIWIGTNLDGIYNFRSKP